MNRGMLLHAPLEPVAPGRWPRQLLDGLPYARRLALERRPDAERYASLAGIALALCACARVTQRPPPDVRTLVAASGGKPAFPDAPGFSISHCASHVACIACQSGAVGLDIEDLPGRLPREEIARWTAIEAVLKLTGAGLRAVAAVELAADGAGARLAGQFFRLQAVPGLREGLTAHVASSVPLEVEVAGVSLADPEVASAVERSLGLLP